nr:uncharacterized protein LOC129159970 [Nothobranchius furzeri]
MDRPTQDPAGTPGTQEIYYDGDPDLCVEFIRTCARCLDLKSSEFDKVSYMVLWLRGKALQWVADHFDIEDLRAVSFWDFAALLLRTFGPDPPPLVAYATSASQMGHTATPSPGPDSTTTYSPGGCHSSSVPASVLSIPQLSQKKPRRRRRNRPAPVVVPVDASPPAPAVVPVDASPPAPAVVPVDASPPAPAVVPVDASPPAPAVVQGDASHPASAEEDARAPVQPIHGVPGQKSTPLDPTSMVVNGPSFVGPPDDDVAEVVGPPDDDVAEVVGPPDDDVAEVVGPPDDDVAEVVGPPDDDVAEVVGPPDDDVAEFQCLVSDIFFTSSSQVITSLVVLQLVCLAQIDLVWDVLKVQCDVM